MHPGFHRRRQHESHLVTPTPLVITAATARGLSSPPEDSAIIEYNRQAAETAPAERHPAAAAPKDKKSKPMTRIGGDKSDPGGPILTAHPPPSVARATVDSSEQPQSRSIASAANPSVTREERVEAPTAPEPRSGAFVVGQSSLIIPNSSAVPQHLPLIPPNRGYAGRRPIGPTAAELWIDQITARYGGLQQVAADDDSADGRTIVDPPPPVEVNAAPPNLMSLVALGSSTPLFTSVRGARLRKQIFALCQKLVVEAHKENKLRGGEGKGGGGPPLIEVEVRERGHVTWHSASCDDAEMDEADLAVEAAHEDVKEVQRRAKRAFRSTVAAFRGTINGLKEELLRAKAEAAAKDAGGSRFQALVGELEQQRLLNHQQQSKMKALLKLLERAGATIKQLEEQHQQDQAMHATRSSAESAPDWEAVRAAVPELVTEDREASGILRDVVDYIDQLKRRLAESEASSEMFGEKYAEKDEQYDKTRRERDGLLVKLRLLESTHDALRTEHEGTLSTVAALHARLDEQRLSFAAERDRLISQTVEAEAAMRRTVEAKPVFTGLGRGLSVPPFLRFEGRVRNLDLCKKDVEDMINAVWAARETQGALERAQKTIVALWERGADDRGGIDFGLGVAGDQLIDYDNVRFVKRAAGSFAEHVTIFLFERFAVGDTGGTDAVTPKGDAKTKTRLNKAALRQVMRRYGFTVPVAVAEQAYSLMEGCEKFKYDADIELFRRVVKNDISETAYVDQMVMMAKLRAALQHDARITGNGSTQTIDGVIRTVQRFFPAKSPESVDLLRRALMADVPEAEVLSDPGLATVQIHQLFVSNEHGNQGHFMERLRDQHLDEICTYVSEVADCISECAVSPDNTKGKLVSLALLRRHLHDIDPLKPQEDVNRFLHDAYTALMAEERGDDAIPPPNVVHLDVEVDVEKLARVSKSVFSKRYGPKNVESDPWRAVDGPSFIEIANTDAAVSTPPPPPSA